VLRATIDQHLCVAALKKAYTVHKIVESSGDKCYPAPPTFEAQPALGTGDYTNTDQLEEFVMRISQPSSFASRLAEEPAASIAPAGPAKRKATAMNDRPLSTQRPDLNAADDLAREFHSTLKPLANKLANELNSPDGAKLLKTLMHIEVLGEAALTTIARKAAVNRVGIWQMESGSNSQALMRAADLMHEWHLWASVPRIEPKHTRWRLAYIGESAARGYFYDPMYTPAETLQNALDQCLGPDTIEVVDLARTSLNVEVSDLAISAAALAPNIVVIFAGNNWHPAFSEQDRAYQEGVLALQGVVGLKAFAEKKLEVKARSIVMAVGEFFSARNVPVVWVVPESNLLDGHAWSLVPPPLPEIEQAEWLTIAVNAQRALGEGDLDSALSAVQRLLTLDKGVCGYSLNLWGTCMHHLGRLQEAREALEQARDAQIWDRSDEISPRPYAVTQNVLRGAVDRGGIVVDLPKLFAEHRGGALPDRSLFLDYCHLTDEGIRLSMAAVAARVAERLSGQHQDWRTVFAKTEPACAEIRAEAAFLAAIHNAHWCQPRYIIEHHCAEALRTSPHVAEIMNCFLDIQTSVVPALLNRAGQRMADVSNPATQRYLLGPHQPQRLDEGLLMSVARALEPVVPTATVHLLRRWAQLRSVAHQPANLLSVYYLSSASPTKEQLWALDGAQKLGHSPMNDYYRAYRAETEFLFIGTRGRSVQFELTYRVPGTGESSEFICISINNIKIDEVPVNRSWTSHRIYASGTSILEGVNRLMLKWPAMDLQQEQSLGHGRSHLSASLYLESLFRTFGEVHQLKAFSCE
jgi:hypothetical protein